MAQTFPCDNGARLYFFQATGGNGSLSYITNYTTTPVVTQMFTMPTATHNALGANPVDNYLYYLSGPTLNRLDASGNSTVVCTLPGGSLYGCFDSWGRFWIVNGLNLEAFDINTCSIVKGPFPISGSGMLDIAFNPYDCYLYFANVRCDTNGVIDVGYSGTQFSPTGTYGGIAIGTNGNLYGIAGTSGTGNLSTIDISLNQSTNVFNYSPGPTYGQSDMASFVCQQPVTANFGFASTSCSNLVSFTDSSLGNITTWNWNFGDPISGPNNTSFLQNPTHAFSAAGTYTVTLIVQYIANGCMPGSIDTFSLVVTVGSSNTTVTSTILGTIACFGNCNASVDANMTGGTSPYTYLWNNGQTTQIATGLCAGNYSIVVTDANGCTANTSISITQPTLLSVTIPPANSICVGQNVILTSTTAGGTPGYSYLWNTGSTTTSISVSPIITTTYTLSVTDANGCNVNVSITVTVNPPPVVQFAADTLQGCAPLCVNFTNSSTTSQNCSWTFGNGSSSTNCNPNYCYTIPGTYNVSLTITDINGCTNSLTLTNYISVYAIPQAEFAMNSQQTSIAEPEICFTDHSTGAVNWTWDFGDQNDPTPSSLQNPCHSYSDTGTYCVTLRVSNQYNCTSDIIHCLHVESDFTFYAPNAFTPNDNGMNEGFIPKGIGWDESTFEMLIFDRWGNLIYKTSDSNKPWDGRANGGKELAQEDVYVWKVRFNDLNGKQHNYVGHVAMIK